MVTLPSNVIELCRQLGINSYDPGWTNVLQEFFNSRPLVDVVDDDTLADLHHYLSARIQAPEPAPNLHDSGHIPFDPNEFLRTLRDIALQFHAQLPPTRPRSPAASSSLKIAEPAKFTGLDRKRLRPWIATIRLKMAAERSKFPNERSKVAYALSYLSELAFQHYEPDVLQGLDHADAPPHFATLDLFLKHLEDTFGDKGGENSALREITSISQGNGPTYAYYTKFLHLTPYLSWTGTAFRDHFYKGLKDEVKDELAKCPLPPTLEELGALAIEIDNRFHERRQDKRGHSGVHSTGGFRSSSHKATNSHAGFPTRPRANSAPPADHSFYSTSRTVSSAPAPMEIDATAPRSRLSPQEKQRRKDAGLCLYCGNVGHYASKCPLKSRFQSGSSTQPRTRVSGLSYTISGPNANLDTAPPEPQLLLDQPLDFPR